MEYSLIIPVYNETESILALCERIFAVLNDMRLSDFEILFVDDGSTDGSRNVLRKLSRQHENIKGIFLRQNFGKSHALVVGFNHARGKHIITMDADLQDRPEEMPKLIKKIHEGYDLVIGHKQNRKDSKIRVWGSWLFNKTVSYFGGLKLNDFNCGYKICKAEVFKSIAVFGQYHRFIPLLAHYSGYKVAEVPIKHAKRRYGISKYPTFRYQGVFDLLSILFTYKYKFSPLYFFGVLGGFFFIPSFIILFYLAFRHTLFILGLGENYISEITLLLPLATTVCILGVNIFLTGFVCDFILCHRADEINKSIELTVEEIV